VETIFEKKVVKVNTMIMPAKRGQRGRRSYWRSKEWKKAIVTLAPGEQIDLFEV
jgi:large subunit ribosomal protein L23